MSTLEGEDKEDETPTTENAPKYAKEYQTSVARKGPSSFGPRHDATRLSKKGVEPRN